MAKNDWRVVAVAAASSRLARGTTTRSKIGSLISAAPRTIIDVPKIVPPVSTPLIVDIGFTFDPVGEWPACVTGSIGAHDDGDGVRTVILHADEFFPIARFNSFCYGGLLAEKLLGVIDDFSELTVGTALKNSDEFLRNMFRMIGLG